MHAKAHKCRHVYMHDTCIYAYRHDTFMCETRLIHMCDMSHSSSRQPLILHAHYCSFSVLHSYVCCIHMCVAYICVLHTCIEPSFSCGAILIPTVAHADATQVALLIRLTYKPSVGLCASAALYSWGFWVGAQCHRRPVLAQY